MLIILEIAVLLWIRPVSEALDKAFTVDISNLFLRVIIFIGMALLGYAIAVSFKYWAIASLLGGWTGLAILAICTSLITVSIMLGANQARISETTVANVMYTVTWRGYWAYVGVLLMVVLLPVAISPVHRPALRISSGLISIFGFGGILALGMSIGVDAMPGNEPTALLYITDGISALGLLGGLLALWAARHDLNLKKLLSRLRRGPQ